MAVEKKRVFVGGLFHGVTEQQVCERFNKFGHVNSVSVRVKTDETGQPVKTFAYVDITASEKSLRQCMQVYNKSKWKGSVLQLELAKENFLDRLKKEQTEAKEQTATNVGKLAPETEESPAALKVIPKKATPGTLVGEEKTWVVAKYGRVLPIVNIRRKDKKRVILFDPSKCCHQVKKLDTTAKSDNTEKPVDSLTWQLEDDNSMMAKLRTGQIAWKSAVKRRKTPPKTSLTTAAMDHGPKTQEVSVDDLQFEVVKPHSMYGAHQQDDDEAYSSADTEEMITQMKSSSLKTCVKDFSHSGKVGVQRTVKSPSVHLKSKTCLDVLKCADISTISPIGVRVNGSCEKLQSLSMRGQLNKLKPHNQRTLKTSTPKDVGAKRVYNSDTESDSSLEQLASKQRKKKKPKIVRCNESDGSQDTDDIISDMRQRVSTRNAWTTTSSERSLYMTANDELQPFSDSKSQPSSCCDDDDEDVFDLIESGRINQLYKSAKSGSDLTKTSGSLQEQGPEIDEENTSQRTVSIQETSVSINDKNTKDDVTLSSSKKVKQMKSKVKKTSETASSGNVSKDDTNTKEKANLSSSNENKLKKSKVKKMSESISSIVTAKSEEKGKRDKKEKSAFTQKFDKRKLSNAQRVTSVNERLKEARSQKFLIKKALSDVDKASAKKIMFDSSDEEDNVAPQTVSTSEKVEDGSEDSDDSSTEDNTHSQEKKNKGLLFDSDSRSSESEAEDQQMFQLRPEFEGKAGSKLMKLQSRFRNDQRFKLDKKFLESDSEGDSEEEVSDHKGDLEEGSDERARSLAILKSVVGEKAVQHINQRTKKKATFKDVASLHYDPSREDHKQFELEQPSRKADEDSEEELVNQTSKKKKKKKKNENEPSEEAAPPPEKLPGKFFEVSGALKDLLKPAEKQPFSLLSMFGTTKVDQSENKKKLNEAAVAEKMPDGHMLWQPQFGSDDSDEEAEGTVHLIREETKAAEPVSIASSGQEHKTFFFSDDDPRITDGIKSFCRPADWEATREKWLEKRPDLVEDYRMKRKRAMRKSQSQSQHGNFGRTQRGGRR